MIDIDPIDKLLGNNLRFLRLIRGLTQTEVGEILQVSFQQIQKYEQGTNRISARTLYKLKSPLKVEYQDFFTPVSHYHPPLMHNEHDKIILNIVKHCNAIQSMQKKKALLAFIKELTKEE